MARRWLRGQPVGLSRADHEHRNRCRTVHLRQPRDDGSTAVARGIVCKYDQIGGECACVGRFSTASRAFHYDPLAAQLLQQGVREHPASDQEQRMSCGVNVLLDQRNYLRYWELGS